MTGDPGPIGPTFALARLSVGGCEPFPAVVKGGKVLALWGASGLRRELAIPALLASWMEFEQQLTDLDFEGSNAGLLRDCRIHAPLTPSAVYCTIGNYRAQVVEAMTDADPSLDVQTFHASLDRRQREGTPYIVQKPVSSVAGPFDVLFVDADARTLDWEVEIGVVIGQTTRNADVRSALGCVAGYCTVNDITLRERLFRSDPKGMGTDFLQAKGGPGWLPMGPWLVPASHVLDPSQLRLSLSLNGEVMQEGVASDMLFNIAEQIAYLSKHVELSPGDLICTGSPAGFGSHHKRFIRAGDTVEACVEGLGRQRVEARNRT